MALNRKQKKSLKIYLGVFALCIAAYYFLFQTTAGKAFVAKIEGK